MTKSWFANYVLELMATYDVQESLEWDKDLNFHINCNDVFFLGLLGL